MLGVESSSRLLSFLALSFSFFLFPPSAVCFGVVCLGGGRVRGPFLFLKERLEMCAGESRPPSVKVFFVKYTLLLNTSVYFGF